jgi:hypothetical protein
MSRDIRNCPVAVMFSAGGGHQICPVVAARSAWWC